MKKEVERIVFSYPKLQERIESRDNPEEERRKVLKIIDEIASDFSYRWMDVICGSVHRLLMKFYDNIHFNPKDFTLEWTKNNLVVLVPNHQSHVDYLALNPAFFRKFKVPLYVAGGINLNIVPVGKLFRKCGCFYIRRTFGNDVTYKLTLEGYLYYLLKTGKIVQFFFEGGRTRNGKLRPPRYGLYGMLLEAYQTYSKEKDFNGKRLLFVPVSINHEYLPDAKSLVKEMRGKKKIAEKGRQIFGLVRFFTYRFGSIHMEFGRPIPGDSVGPSRKESVEALAFRCFREVGRNLKVTPSSLLSMALLDEPGGVLLWSDIVAKCKAVRDYCEEFQVPLSEGLRGNHLIPTLERTIDIFIGNRKIDVISARRRGNIYYSIRRECRPEFLYFKNTILHHFLIPSIINLGWINLMRGELEDPKDLQHFFILQRKQFKYEFYLPRIKQVFYRAMNIVGKAVGERVGSLEDIAKLSRQQIYSIVQKIGIFGRSLSYILEGHYLSSLAVRGLSERMSQGFKKTDYVQEVREIYRHEVGVGRIIRYPESLSVELMGNAMKYFQHQGIIHLEEGVFKVIDSEQLDRLIQRYEKDLIDLVTFNIRIQ